jgi:S-adenosylmethionine:tRNA ribosyltransferase-isomerase
MRLKDFDYELPEEKIAQNRLAERDESKLLILNPDYSIIDEKFHNIHHYLDPGDLLVFNDSKVIKAHLNLYKETTKISINLNKEISKNIWSGFAKPAKKLEVGDSFDFSGNNIIIKEKHEDGLVEFEFDLKTGISVFDFLEIYGSTPIPPYIRGGEADDEDEDTYQTIYSKERGSVAAPTAGLHFTDNVFVNLQKKNVEFCFVTLHVGAGTFLPVKTENIEDHKMHSEYSSISEDAAKKINIARAEGRKIIAVGTTSVRTLESCMQRNDKIIAETFETDIFIKPGFEFKVVDRLITNFHMPKSTLMMLVSAFAGHERIIKAYNHALKRDYRFLSYGDAMLLTKFAK